MTYGSERDFPWSIDTIQIPAISFYKTAFGATEKFRLTEPSGRIGHAELDFGGTTIMIWGPDPYDFAAGLDKTVITVAGLPFYPAQLYAIGALALLTALAWAFMRFTRMGVAMRAVAANSGPFTLPRIVAGATLTCGLLRIRLALPDSGWDIT